jgi:hypothetical protein
MNDSEAVPELDATQLLCQVYELWLDQSWNVVGWPSRQHS